jgi:hypothetical protein
VAVHLVVKNLPGGEKFDNLPHRCYSSIMDTVEESDILLLSGGTFVFPDELFAGGGKQINELWDRRYEQAALFEEMAKMLDEALAGQRA